jgi:hypothetical protein
MNAARSQLDSPDSLQSFIRPLAQARGRADIVDAVRQYLESWPAERVSRVQPIDAGWAPFDLQQHASPPLGALDLRRVRDALHEQCVALTSAGLHVEPDLVELDLFLSLACQKLEEVSSELGAARPAAGEASRHA